MRGFHVGLAACLAIFSHLAMAEPTFAEKLDGAAAGCAIVGGSGHTEAILAMRKFGEQSKKYQALVEKSFRDAKACVEEAKPKMKPTFREEISRYPQIKPALTDAYAAWLGYMDWLSTPHEFSATGPESQAYEAAINRLRAEVEAL
ncbi:hypothetical protein NRB16_07930 [Pseudomonas sp. LJDD11]|uniref:hypothetical protein n=1 Tax=Pseudomonas sp. LJDD11 TaxID=2931984 RepID=UPI00211B8EB4|nr:hypothetical protein [Pseudomonas sp. LJDD11]MCQ9423448.1 hypothetical protein [Pseudomonas sp. LJDD11]